MAMLSYAQKKALPRSAFALPPKQGQTNQKGQYDIGDRSHAQNALSRVSRWGNSGQKAAVRAAVLRRYPGLGQ